MTLNLQNYTLDEDSNGDLVIKDTNDNNVFRYDSSVGEWNLEGTSLTNISSVSTDQATLNGGGRPGILQKQSQSVTANNTAQSIYIYDNGFRPAGLVLVYARTSSTEGFTDIVLVSEISTIVQVSSTSRGSPGTRSYSNNGDLALSWDGDGENYQVTTIALGDM